MWGKKLSDNLKTWVEISEKAAAHNCQFFRGLLGAKTKLWAVVKSNAYGHGLLVFSRLVNGSVDGFCVDSVVEGIALRNAGIKKPILVLGPTLPAVLSKAAVHDIAVSVSNLDALRAIVSQKRPPQFHIKVDTGMRRQGFYPEELPKVIRVLRSRGKRAAPLLRGAFTHFASAKDINYPTFTDSQIAQFERGKRLLVRSGFKNLCFHSASTGGTLMGKKYHLDAVRIGTGLYGLPPSPELAMQLSELKLQPVLSWRTVVAEVKRMRPGDYVGYDLVERLMRPTKAAVLPIGYWHGFPRSLSSVGEVLIRGERARVLGRVSMDLLVVDATRIACRPGDTATIIGRDRRESLRADEVAHKSGTTHYEFLARLNPLMERVVVS